MRFVRLRLSVRWKRQGAELTGYLQWVSRSRHLVWGSEILLMVRLHIPHPS